MQIGRFRDVKIGVKRYFQSLSLRGRTVVDVPAGEGRMSTFLREQGADVHALDLFTHGKVLGDIKIRSADLTERLPLDDASADYVLCQEGIEHLPDQLTCLKEFHRVLKLDGKLIVTAPNASNLRARLGYFFVESNSFRHLPANEADDVWFSDAGKECFGHVFLIGIQKLRVLAGLAGFRIKKIYPTRLSSTAVPLFVLFYPVLLLINLMSYFRSQNRRKKEPVKDPNARARVLREVLAINLDPDVLLGNHLFVEFEKAPVVQHRHL